MARLKQDYISRNEVARAIDAITGVVKDERAKLGRKDPGHAGLGRVADVTKQMKALVAAMDGIKGIAVP